MTFTDHDRQVVALAAGMTAEPHVVRLMRIWNTFGIHPARFYQHVNRLIDDPDARAAMPSELGRLERIREQCRARR